ncbi:DUF485 domain-containing protein [Deinococcus sp. UYEF24]
MQQAQAYGRQDSAFQQLVAERNRFTITMTLVFLVLYFLLPIMAGYNKPLMATKVYGNVTFGYFMAFAEFLMGWIMAAIYMVRVRSFDRLAAQAIAQSGGRP